MHQSNTSFPQIYNTFRTHWAQVDPFLLELFSKKFPNESRLNFNYSSSQGSSTVLISNSITKNDRKRVNNIQNQQQADVLLRLPTLSYLWLKLSADDVKLHYHHGEGVKLLNLPKWQPYFSFSSTRKFNNSSFKLGALSQFDSGYVDFRFRYNIKQHQADHFYYAKCLYQDDDLRFSAIGTILLKANQINLQKNDLMAAYRVFRNSWLGIVLNNEQFRKYRINYSRLGSYFDSLKAAYLFNHRNLRLGMLYQYSIEDSASKKIEAAVEYKFQQNFMKSFKLKLNTQWKMGIAAEATFGRWLLEGGTTWFNVSESFWPSYYAFGLSYY